MLQNDYVGLLDADTIKVKHPITKKEIKLYRTIALKTFKLDRYDARILKQLDELKDKKLVTKNEIYELEQKQENFKVVISELTSKEEYRRVKELQSEYDLNENGLEKLQQTLDEINLLSENYQNILDTKVIEMHSIGGYVESLENLDPDNPVWVDHRCRVFDNAKILKGSLVTEGAVIFGNSIIESSRVRNYARIHGDAHIINSSIQDLTEIRGKSRVINTHVKNSAMIFENSRVEDCVLETGSCIRGNSYVKSSILKDTSQIQGDSEVINCKLSGRAVILNGNHQNESFYEDYNLKTESQGE